MTEWTNDTDGDLVVNPGLDQVEEISSHTEHDGFSVFRFGGGDPVDIHISCDECDIRYIIENVPKDKAENPEKYL
jgi:hypothetical protein